MCGICCRHTRYCAGAGCDNHRFGPREDSVDLEKLREAIASCPYYSALVRSGAALLYRGDSDRQDAMFRETVRRDRRPRSTRLEFHTAADEWFSRTFGVRYRGAALFCTGSWDQSAKFGSVIAVLPCDGFRFCWSPSVKDLFDRLEIHRRDASFTPQEFVAALAEMKYTEDNFVSAVASHHEVMVACGSYYGVRLEDQEDARQLLEMLREQCGAEPGAAADRPSE